MRCLALAALSLCAACSTAPGPRPAAGVPMAASSGTVAAPTAAGRAAGPGLPDPALTPGAADVRVTQATIAATICRAGYTRTVRPDVSYTEAVKARQMVAYGRAGSLRLYEEDHLIALEIGGHPTDTRNLWPEPRAGPPGMTAADKDRVEGAAHAAVCAGRLALADAQRAMAANWERLGRDLGVI